MTADGIVFGIGLLVFGTAALRNTVWARRAVLAGHREVQEGGVRGAMRGALPETLLFAVLSALAALRAELRVFWTAAAVLLSLMSVLTLFFAYFAKLAPEAESPHPAPLTPEALEALVARRRRLSPFIVMMTFVWFCSWRRVLGLG